MVCEVRVRLAPETNLWRDWPHRLLIVLAVRLPGDLPGHPRHASGRWCPRWNWAPILRHRGRSGSTRFPPAPRCHPSGPRTALAQLPFAAFRAQLQTMLDTAGDSDGIVRARRSRRVCQSVRRTNIRIDAPSTSWRTRFSLVGPPQSSRSASPRWSSPNDVRLLPRGAVPPRQRVVPTSLAPVRDERARSTRS